MQSNSLSLFLNMSASALVSCTQRLQTCYLDLRTQVALAGRHVIFFTSGERLTMVAKQRDLF